MGQRIQQALPAIVVLAAVILAGFAAFVLPDRQEKVIGNATEKMEEIKTLPDGTKYIVEPGSILTLLDPDRIPSIDAPVFERAADAAWLADADPVLGLDYHGVQKAYPLRILNWHEIVNDPDVGGKPVLVTYCPLCRSGIAFEPLISGERVAFGTSGKLWNSDLVMYDRKTKSLWSQVLGKAIVGPLSGTELTFIWADIASWKDWKAAHPDTLVLSRDIVCSPHNPDCTRDYSYNPYGSEAESPVIGVTPDARLGRKAIVYGVDINNKQKAYPHDKIKDVKVVNDVVGNVSIAVVWDADLNVVKIFKRNDLAFSFAGSQYTDDSGNEWPIAKMEKNLERVETFGHFWFAWAAFFPNTEVFS